MNDLLIDIVCGVLGALLGVLTFMVLRRQRGSRSVRNCDVAGRTSAADIAKYRDRVVLGDQTVSDEDRRYWVAQGAKWLGETIVVYSMVSDRAVNYTWRGLMDGSVELYRKADA